MKKAYQLLFQFFHITIPFIILIISIVHPGINGYERAMFPDMVYGKANKPYVYRLLIPSTVRLIQAILPMQTRININNTLYDNPTIRDVVETLGWEQDFLVDYIIVLILLLISLYGFLSSLKYLIDGLFQAPQPFIDVMALLIVASLPLLFKYYNYIYDFPALFLFTLGLGLLAHRQWHLYLMVFIFSCFNKETTILLSMIFFIHFFRSNMDQGLFWKYLIIQILFFLAIKTIISYLYWNNPGSFVEFHLYDYNLILLRKINLIPTLAIWLPIIFLIFYKWYEKPKLIRDSLWILVPLVTFTLFLGFLDELRDYYETYPIITLLIVYSIGKILKIKIEPKYLFV